MTKSRLLAALAVLVTVVVGIYWLGADPLAVPVKPRASSPADQQARPVEKKSVSAPAPLPVEEPAVEVTNPRERYPLGSPALQPPKLSELSTQDRPPLADRLGAKGTPPETEVRIVMDVLKAYRRYFGVYPVGENNAQFVNALLGANPEMLPFIPHDHSRISSNGELVDAWGTPFEMHLYSRTSLAVRSAGPDREMHTADDLVAEPAAAPSINGSEPPTEQ